MSDSFAASMVEKGLEEWHASPNSTSGDEPTNSFTWKGAVVMLLPMLTLFASAFAIMLMYYAVRGPMLIIACVESPSVGMRRDSNSGKNGILDDEKAVSKRRSSAVHPQSSSNFISSSYRALARHLYAEAGDLSIFRGIGLSTFQDGVSWILERIIYWIVAHFVTKPLGWTGEKKSTYLGQFAFYISSLLLIQWSVAWTHIVVSKPRHVFWFRRLPLSYWTCLKSVSMASLALTIVEDNIPLATSWITKCSIFAVGETSGEDIGWLYVVWRVLVYLLRKTIEPLLSLVFVLPLLIVVSRMSASCLPWKDEPIVPMDRRFGTENNPNTLVEPKAISVADAFRSLNRPTFERLAKVYMKGWLLYVVAEIIVAAAISLQIVVLWNTGSFWPLVKSFFDIPLTTGDQAMLNSTVSGLFSKNVTLANSTSI